MRSLSLALLAILTIVAPVAALAGPTAASAAGSDAPTPYVVSADGLELPAGDVFRDNGHVNVRYELDGRQRPAHAHFEAKCVTRSNAECAGERHVLAQLIGERFLPWDAMGIPVGACITWVQMSAYNQHFGEGGQAPVCRTEPSTPSEPEPSEPAPSEPAPSEPAPAEPTPSEPAVVAPQIQDYVGACDAAFVLDNRASTVAVVYTIQGIEYRVPAGGGVHTDADGTRILPVDGRYVITTDTGRTWTFPARACTTSTPPSEPTPSEPAPSEPTPSEPAPSEPTPSEPAPSEPAPSEPTPSEPTPSEPAPSEPTPNKPAPSEPTPSEPAPSEPAPSEPAPSEPAPSEPTPFEPGVDVPAVDPPTEPTPSEEAPAASEQPPATEQPEQTDAPAAGGPVPERDESIEIGTPAADAQPGASAEPVVAQQSTTQPAATAATTLPRTGAEPLHVVLLLGAVLLATGVGVRLARR